MFRIRYFNNPHFCTIVIDLNTPLGSFVSLDDQESASFSKLTPWFASFKAKELSLIKLFGSIFIKKLFGKCIHPSYFNNHLILLFLLDKVTLKSLLCALHVQRLAVLFSPFNTGRPP
jgi:hypothetical protein